MTTVVLVHGAFAESAGWSGVVERLRARSVDVVAVANPLRSIAIRPDAFHHQFCADVPAATAAVMSATQRPVTAEALTAGLPTDAPAWQGIPSWFVFSDQDLNIPVALHRFLAERAAAKGVREIAGASHALSVSRPEAVTASILEAVRRRRGRPGRLPADHGARGHPGRHRRRQLPGRQRLGRRPSLHRTPHPPPRGGRGSQPAPGGAGALRQRGFELASLTVAA
jgi:pimeloyl-ACP methyl ester carboxylesterase